MSSFNYAAAFGIHSVAAAGVFSALYCILGVWFVRQSFKNTTYVYIVLTLFCLMRIPGFIIRAVMANSAAAGSNLQLFIADQVLFGVGFFALLYSAYTLVLDRDVLAGGKRGGFWSLNLMRNSHLFRIILMAGVAVGIVGTVDSTSSDASQVSTGHTLRQAGTGIFLVLTVVQAGQSILFFRDTPQISNAWGDRHGRYLICFLSLLMLIREIFLTATINNSSQQNNERLWYPLVALPEFLAVLCYSVSGLVPPRAALKEAENRDGEYKMQSA
ncbi:hypothetical protein R3P38DRAFT_1962145 [Favolaschia claudopus]|uniref:DUF7702 domain-containing protein n=1 Tax=Favolaschia claudopus TaxID=2862362 RepID=A0AAV9ZZ22_9AGAR